LEHEDHSGGEPGATSEESQVHSLHRIRNPTIRARLFTIDDEGAKPRMKNTKSRIHNRRDERSHRIVNGWATMPTLPGLIQVGHGLVAVWLRSVSNRDANQQVKTIASY
jgi:hypothetical protein